MIYMLTMRHSENVKCKQSREKARLKNRRIWKKIAEQSKNIRFLKKKKELPWQNFLTTTWQKSICQISITWRIFPLIFSWWVTTVSYTIIRRFGIGKRCWGASVNLYLQGFFLETLLNVVTNTTNWLPLLRCAIKWYH